MGSAKVLDNEIRIIQIAINNRKEKGKKERKEGRKEEGKDERKRRRERNGKR